MRARFTFISPSAKKLHLSLALSWVIMSNAGFDTQKGKYYEILAYIIEVS